MESMALNSETSVFIVQIQIKVNNEGHQQDLPFAMFVAVFANEI